MVKTYFKGIRKILNENIANSQIEILVAVAWFTNHELFNALCDRLRNGVKVSLCIVNDEINNREEGLNFQTFIQLGGRLYFSKENELMHHKFCIIDNSTLFNGSYNWTYYAENRNRENIILFKEIPELITDFRREFELTISECDLVNDYYNYIKYNKPQYSQELSKYLSYDLMYQAKQTFSHNNYKKADELISKSLKYNRENVEAKIEQRKLEVVIANNPEVKQQNNPNDKIEFDLKQILRELEQSIFDNYLSENPDRNKAFISASAIYEYEKENNFSNTNCYNTVNPGYIMMVFGQYDKAQEFFKRNQSALGFYDYGVLSLLRNDLNNFATFINKALDKLGNADQSCAALYIPKLSKGMTEYIEKKQTNMKSTDTMSLKDTIMKIKQDFKI
jgi:hypothetical protein